MQIPFKKTLFSLFFITLCLNASAQYADVVKQEGRKVYFDVSAMSRFPQEGDFFEVILPGAEITNPKTGKVLGREEGERVAGKVVKTKDLYAIGFLDKNIDVAGSCAEFTSKAARAKTPLFLDGEFPEQNSLRPLWQSSPMEASPRFAAACDFDGDGQNEIALSFKEGNSVKVFSLDDKRELKEEARYNVAAIKNILALDCGDLQNSGAAVLFVTVFNPADESFSVIPLSLKDGRLKAGKVFEGLVQGIAPYNRPRVLYTQKIVKIGSKYYLSKPAKLEFKNKKYEAGQELNVRGLNAIFGFNMADLTNDGILTPVYITANGKIRAGFDEPKDFSLNESGRDFAFSPNTFNFNGVKQNLYTPLAVFTSGEKRNLFIAALQNDKSGKNANLYFLKWLGANFAKYKVFTLPAPVYDMKQGDFGPFKDVLILPLAFDKKGALAVYAADNI